MATGSCTKDNLLTVFSDNTTQNITAADMRLLVNCIYDNFLDIINVIDNTDTYIPYQALSANQGAILNDRIETNEININSLEQNKIDKNLVYDKSESDSRYYTQSTIDYNYYKKTETYSKQEIDNAIFMIESQLQAISERIDCLAQEVGSNC